jgi:hypothetical protein
MLKNNLHKHLLSIILTIFMSFMFFAVGVFAEEEPGGDTPQTFLVTINSGTGSGSYAENTVVEITAAAPDGQAFVSWSTESAGVYFVDSVSQTTWFSMPANEVTITANFAVLSSDATLSSLSISPGSIIEAFSAETTTYTATVPYDTENITITAEPTDLNASIYGNTGEQPFLIDELAYTILVEAEDGLGTNEYTITVVREAAPTDAEIVSADYDALDFNDFKGLNTLANAIESNLDLPIVGESIETTITWSSSDETIIATDGTVTRPHFVTSAAAVTLTATITKGEISADKDFELIVLKAETPVSFDKSLILTSSGLTYDGYTVGSGAQDVLGGGSYSYNSSTNTLTLTSVIFSAITAKALDLTAVSGVTLDLEGNNSFISVYNGSTSTSGIHSSESVIIKSTAGTGTLTATGGTSSGESIGINADSLTVDSGTVYANSGSGNNNFGIQSDFMTVNGGSVTATAPVRNNLSRAVYIKSDTGYLNITGGTLTATGSTTADSSGILSFSPITISGGIVAASGYKYGIRASNTTTAALSISGGTVTATGGQYGISAAVNGEISISDGTLDVTGVTAAFNTDPTLPAAYEWEADEADGEYPFDELSYDGEQEVYINVVPLQTKIYSTDLTFDKADPEDIEIIYTLADNVTLQNVQIDGTTVDYTPTPNLITIDDAAISALSLADHTIKLLTDSSIDPTITVTVMEITTGPFAFQSGDLLFQAGRVANNDSRLGGGSYDYNYDTNTLTLSNVNYTNDAEAALYIDDPVTINVSGTNVLRTVSESGSTSAIGGNEALVLDGTGSLTAESYAGKAFSSAPTILMSNYTWEAIDNTGAKTSGTNDYVYSGTHRKVTITYKAPDPVPQPNTDDDDDNSGHSPSGTSGRTGGQSMPLAPPPKIENTEETDDEDTDGSNKEGNSKIKVNGTLSDTSVAMPTEPGDKTADVKIDGETVETYSLTAAEAIADGEVKEAFVSETGAIAAITTSGNVIAGANATESLNSASTIAALKKAVEEAAATVTEDGEIEKRLITITAGQEVTGVSDNTLEKIIAVSEGSGIDTQIQKRQYSLDENGQIQELIYRITIPVVSDNIQDIRLGAEFSTAVVEASEIAFEKTFGNTDCAGFALTQKDSFGTEATIQVRLSAIGFEAEAGDTVYVAIFNPTTGRYTQVEGRVGESGFITFKTDKSGVVVISATPYFR